MATEQEKTEQPNGLETIPHSDAHVFDLKEVKQRVDAIHRIMAKMMKKDVHYGVIPGTKKPTLYKPGSEILLLTFRVAVEPEITDLSTADEVRYRIRAFGHHVPTDSFMGAGVGECSSNEEKFLWRAALSREEYEETPLDQKRIKYKKEWDRGRPAVIKVEQIKVPPADAANAVLKRAKKRAQVDFVLTAMAASEIFTQDVEDLPDGYLNENGEGAPGVSVSPEQLKELTTLYNKLDAEWRKKKALEVWGVESLKDLRATQYKKAKADLEMALKSPAKQKQDERVNQDQEATLTTMIEPIGGNCKAEFLKEHQIKRIGELPASKYESVMETLKRKQGGI